MEVLTLTTEKGDKGLIWGRLMYKEDLMVEYAKSVEELEKQFKRLLKDFYNLEPGQIQFEVN